MPNTNSRKNFFCPIFQFGKFRKNLSMDEKTKGKKDQRNTKCHCQNL